MNRQQPVEPIRRVPKNDIKPQVRPQLQRECYVKKEGQTISIGSPGPQKLKTDMQLRSRFEPAKKYLLQMANDCKEGRLFLVEELQLITTQIKNLGMGTINSPHLQLASRTKSTQTEFVERPLFYQQISEIHERFRQLDGTMDQPEYSRVRQELYNEAHADNLMLNRQNLKLAEEIAEIAETNDSLNVRCLEITRRYEELQKTLSQLYESGSVRGSQGCPDTETVCQKDDLLGDYFKPMFSPRSSNLSSKRCISPRALAQFVTADAETYTTRKIGFQRCSPLSLNFTIAVQTDELPEQKIYGKNNLEARLSILTADNKVKSAIIERLEHSMTTMLQKQPGTVRLTYDNVQMMIDEISNKKPYMRRIERRTTIGYTKAESSFDLDHCKSDTKLGTIPENPLRRKLSRRRM